MPESLQDQEREAHEGRTRGVLDRAAASAPTAAPAPTQASRTPRVCAPQLLVRDPQRHTDGERRTDEEVETGERDEQRTNGRRAPDVDQAAGQVPVPARGRGQHAREPRVEPQRVDDTDDGEAHRVHQHRDPDVEGRDQHAAERGAGQPGQAADGLEHRHQRPQVVGPHHLRRHRPGGRVVHRVGDPEAPARPPRGRRRSVRRRRPAPAPRRARTATRAALATMTVRRVSHRSAKTPPTRMNAARGRVPMPTRSPAWAGPTSVTAVQARAISQTVSPRSDNPRAATQACTRWSRRRGGTSTRVSSTAWVMAGPGSRVRRRTPACAGRARPRSRRPPSRAPPRPRS